MTRYAIWDQPFSMDPMTNVESRMTFEDVVKYQRHREPRYTDDEDAFQDFLVVHWGREETYLLKGINEDNNPR